MYIDNTNARIHTYVIVHLCDLYQRTFLPMLRFSPIIIPTDNYKATDVTTKWNSLVILLTTVPNSTKVYPLLVPEQRRSFNRTCSIG